MLGVAAAAHLQVDVRLWQLQILKEDIGHVQVVMLPSPQDLLSGACPGILILSTYKVFVTPSKE